MSNRRVYLGFGGVKLSVRQDEVSFPYGSGIISYTPEQELKRTVNGTYIRFFKGFSVKISCRLTNATLTDSYAFQDLASFITRSFSLLNEPITVKPRFDFESQSGLSYDCFLTSSISPEDIGNTAAAQTITLEFESKTLIQTLPILLSNQVTYLWSDGEGNTIVDGEGNNIVFRA